MVLLYQKQNVVDIDFHLPDQLYLKDDIVVDIGAFPSLPPLGPLVLQVLVAAQIILQVPLRQDITALELVKGGQDIPHPQDRAEKRNEVLFILLPNDPRFRQRKFCQQLMDKSLIAGVLGAVFICVTAEIILKAPQQYDAACLLVPKERDGIVYPLL